MLWLTILRLLRLSICIIAEELLLLRWRELLGLSEERWSRWLLLLGFLHVPITLNEEV